MESLVSQGLPVALFGIGIVFVFLCLLVAVTHAMSALAARLGPVFGAAPATPAPPPVSPALMAAATAAVAMHRARGGPRR